MLKYLNKDQIPHYKAGMYGGKFLPMHKGHLYCVETASKEERRECLIFERSLASLINFLVFRKRFRPTTDVQ